MERPWAEYPAYVIRMRKDIQELHDLLTSAADTFDVDFMKGSPLYGWAKEYKEKQSK